MKTLTDDLPLFCQRHSATSIAAARDIEPATHTLRAQVLAHIRSSGGATDEEIQTALGMEGSTQRPRRVELIRQGLIRDSGRKRLTSSRRQAVVWEAI